MRKWLRGLFNRETQEKVMRAKIEQTVDGFALKYFDGTIISNYTRRRDALRGASRRGLVLA